VVSVCPTSLLTLQSEDLPEGGAVVWQSGDIADVFVLQDRQPIAWYSVPATASDVALAIGPHLLASGGRFRASLRGVEGNLRDELGHLPDFEIADASAGGGDEAALRGARRIVAGAVSPWIDLRRDEGLGSARQGRATTMAIAACTLLVVCLCGAFVVRGMRYEALVDQYQQQKEAAFRQVFRNAVIPIGIESRLRSAADRLRAPTVSTRGIDRAATLVMLGNVLSALPPAARFQVDEIDAEPHGVTLNGNVASLTAANQITASLRRAAALQVDDPRTQTLADGTIGLSMSVSDRLGHQGEP